MKYLLIDMPYCILKRLSKINIRFVVIVFIKQIPKLPIIEITFWGATETSLTAGNSLSAFEFQHSLDKGLRWHERYCLEKRKFNRSSG